MRFRQQLYIIRQIIAVDLRIRDSLNFDACDLRIPESRLAPGSSHSSDQKTIDGEVAEPKTGIEKPRHEDGALQAKLLIALGVDLDRATADLCRRIGIVSTTQLIIVDDHVAIVLVPDLDAEQVNIR